jgi:hypothetical protein
MHMITSNMGVRHASIYVVLYLSAIAACPGQAQAGTVNHPKNTFSGPCVGFYAHILQNGPADSQGVYHAEWAGWAGYATFYVNYKSEWKYQTTKPEPVGSGYRVCVKPVDLKAGFYSSTTKDILRWTPETQVSPACLQENIAWTKAALNHEEDHEKITHQFIAEKNRTWNPAGFQSEACDEGADENEAMNKAKASLERIIHSQLQAEAEQLEEKIMKKQKEHDDMNPVRLINCSICGAVP